MKNHKKIRKDSSMASARYVFKKVRWLLAIIIAMLAVTAVSFYASHPVQTFQFIQVGSLVSTATVMGMVGNIKGVSNVLRNGKKIKYKLFLLSVDQIDPNVSFPVVNGQDLGNIPLKAGEYWHYIETIRNSPELKNAGADGDNTSEITNTFTVTAGGIADALIKLLKTGLGEYFYVVWEDCSTGNKYIVGDGCQPVKLLSFEGGPGKDFTGYSIVFENKSSELFLNYLGNNTLQAPEVVTADATSITLTGNEAYQLQSGTSASATVTTFSAVTDSDVGRIVTIVGPSATPAYPSTITGDDFLLIGGVAWVANANASISFKIFKDGASTYKFMEIDGTRV